jgi:hypothetical protein
MNFMTEYRGLIMVAIVLPLSFLFEQYFEFRDWFYRTFKVAPKLHDVRVKRVQVSSRQAGERPLLDDDLQADTGPMHTLRKARSRLYGACPGALRGHLSNRAKTSWGSGRSVHGPFQGCPPSVRGRPGSH